MRLVVVFLLIALVYAKKHKKKGQNRAVTAEPDFGGFKKEKPKGFASPKDEVYFGKIQNEDDDFNDKNETFWHDFVGYHRRNINISPEIRQNDRLQDIVVERHRMQNYSPPRPVHDPQREFQKYQYFDKLTFDLARNLNASLKGQKVVNWTSCAEFRRKADFHPKDVINTEWVPFYVWSENQFRASSVVHTFKYPTVKLVREYKDKYSRHINERIDWEEPKLVMQESMQMLLIAGDRRGLFTAIPNVDLPARLPAYAKIQTAKLRMKLVGPYLALMMCDMHYAVIMGASGSEPTEFDKILTEAATLRFKGTGNPVKRDMEWEKEAIKRDREHKLKVEEYRYIDAN